jgi:hypothetical protein
MTLRDLVETALPHFAPSTQKDVKTAVRMLALALSYPEPKACPLRACQLPLETLCQRAEAYLVAQGKGRHTIRNTKNNLRRLFRWAEAQQLTAIPPATPTRRFPSGSRPAVDTAWKRDGSYLRRRDWPAHLAADFDTFAAWATAVHTDGRDARWVKRPSTLAAYLKTFEMYFGFLVHVQYVKDVHWHQLYDLKLIRAFVHWYVNLKHKRSTHFTFHLLKNLIALTRQYQPDPALRAELIALRKSLPTPTPLRDKSNGWIPLSELDRIGTALWPTRLPHQIVRSGTRTASQAGLSLMFRLWCYIPLRQRNIREMRLHEHLYQDHHGQWRLRFKGQQLKIATKKGRENILDLPFPAALIPALEAYLSTWWPILHALHSRQEVFLSRAGTPYTLSQLYSKTTDNAYVFTGKRWHPHLIRTIWATEWLRSHGDYYTAAIMLNDNLETVIRNYAHLREENVAEKAYHWVDSQRDPSRP